MCAAMPPALPSGRKLDKAPARRSAQSLGRKVLPAFVTPWMKSWRGLGGVVIAGDEAASLVR